MSSPRPIGNLGDITLRALEVLRAVPLIAAEDTRHTHRLLARHGIDDEDDELSRAQRAGAGRRRCSSTCAAGADLALVTDAGTPASATRAASSSRPGRPRAGTVVPLPGASAVLAAVAGSGVAGPRWTFEGFLPRSGRERRERLARIAADERGAVVYEAPGRVAATLADLAAACGGARAGGRLPRADQAPRVDRPRDPRRAGGRGGRRAHPGARGVRAGRRAGRGGACERGRRARMASPPRTSGSPRPLAEVERLVAGGAARATRPAAWRPRAASRDAASTTPSGSASIRP